jgi:hypothetical protein
VLRIERRPPAVNPAAPLYTPYIRTTLVTSTAAREFEAPAPAGHPEPASGPEVSARKAYELTDARGHRARVWWNDGTLAVDADDAALRRRVRRALRKPIWSREDVVDEFGVQSSTLVELQPDDLLLAGAAVRRGMRDR